MKKIFPLLFLLLIGISINEVSSKGPLILRGASEENVLKRGSISSRAISQWLSRPKKSQEKKRIPLNMPQEQILIPTALEAKNPLWTFVIAPHPDDEILCCSETISKQTSQEKKFTKVIYITNGDGLSKENHSASRLYGKRRKRESLSALKKLEIPEENAVFLNFPDGELHRLTSNSVLTSLFTGQKKSDKDSLFPFSPYTSTDLQKNIEALFTQYPPKKVFLPSENDTHSDHSISGKIVQKALKEVKKNPEIFGYTIHGDTQKPLSKINSLKKSLISLFKSQFHDHFHKNYLFSFAKKAEFFIRIKNS